MCQTLKHIYLIKYEVESNMYTLVSRKCTCNKLVQNMLMVNKTHTSICTEQIFTKKKLDEALEEMHLTQKTMCVLHSSKV